MISVMSPCVRPSECNGEQLRFPHLPQAALHPSIQAACLAVGIQADCSMAVYGHSGTSKPKMLGLSSMVIIMFLLFPDSKCPAVSTQALKPQNDFPA